MRKTSPAIGNLLWNGLLHTRFLPAAFSAGSKGDLLHSTTSGASDFLHTIVQKSREAY